MSTYVNSTDTSLGIPHRRGNRTRTETQAKKNVTAGTYKKKTRPHTQNAYIDSQIPSPSPTAEESVGSEQNCTVVSVAEDISSLGSQNNFPPSISEESVGANVENCTGTSVVQIGTADPSESLTDLFKCPLLNWSLCNAYSKKRAFLGNKDLVSAATKVLGVSVSHRSFTLSK